MAKGKDRLKKLMAQAGGTGVPAESSAPAADAHIFRVLAVRSDRPDLADIELTAIRADPDQPRKYFDEVKLQELAASIKEKGLLQPIIIKRVGEGSFRIVCGERRFRACQIAGNTTIRAVIKDDCEDSAEIALIENIQRENLSPIEECMGIRDLINKKGYTQAEAASILGKDQPSISRAIKIAVFIAKVPDKSKIDALVHNSGHKVGIEHLLIAASEETVEGGIAVLEQIIENKMPVSKARGTVRNKLSPLNETGLLKKLNSIRKGLDLSFIGSVKVSDTARYRQELETTLEHLEKTKGKIREEISRITEPA